MARAKTIRVRCGNAYASAAGTSDFIRLPANSGKGAAVYSGWDLDCESEWQQVAFLVET